MNFLFFNTVFLAGLAALAIPVILHFFFRGRRRKLRFSTLRFFVQEDPQQVNRRKLRQLLLMALRMLLIALIVLAFARPYMNESEAGAQAETSNTVILIDVTASMRGGLENGAWDRGLKELRDWVSVFPVGHKVALVACGSSSEVLVHWGAPGLTVQALKELQPGFGSEPLHLGLETALHLLEQPELASFHSASDSIHIFSDFQEESLRELSKISVPEEVQLQFHTMHQSESENVSMTVEIIDDTLPAKARVEIKNHSEKAIQAKLHFTMDGYPKTWFHLRWKVWTVIGWIFPWNG